MCIIPYNTPRVNYYLPLACQQYQGPEIFRRKNSLCQCHFILRAMRLMCKYHQDVNLRPRLLLWTPNNSVHLSLPMTLRHRLMESTPQLSASGCFSTSHRQRSAYHSSSEKLWETRLSAQCDVAVLSYKENCTDSSLPHVRYIFNQSTTFATGRNLLFYTFIHNTSDAYLYYIMIDDDVDMQWLKAGNKGDPWREIEGLLAHVQPAVAGLPLYLHEYKKYEQREKRNCSLGEKYTTATWFDGCFTAFHYQAIEHLLPYWSAMDKTTWWAPHNELMVRSDVLFSGQVVISKRVMLLNTKHRNYPHYVGTTFKEFFSKTLPKIANHAFAKSVPENCPNAPVVQGWRKHGKLYSTDLSPTLCLPPPHPNRPSFHTETLFVTEF